MPNHCENTLTVRGPETDVARFVKECVHGDPDWKPGEGETEESRPEHLDFNALIPMPRELRETTSGSDGKIGYEVWHDPDQSGWRNIASYPWVQELLKAAGLKATRTNVKAVLAAKDPAYKREGDRYNRNILEYGCPTWYEWACREWGTKWNSYNFQEVRRAKGRYDCVFATAWSPPEPVFYAIVEKYPTLTVQYDYSIEGGCGEGEQTLVGEKARA
jgi:hypothetical protein